jgi:putative flippase GtrA
VQSSTLATLARHQVGSLVATLVDFGTMSLLVSGFGLNPVPATAIGAACGGLSNFVLGRTWIFGAQAGGAGPQAVRYVLVSAASLGWNTLGEYVVCNRLGVQYLLARAIVAVVVSLAWNFPLQRSFVFGGAHRPATSGE